MLRGVQFTGVYDIARICDDPGLQLCRQPEGGIISKNRRKSARDAVLRDCLHEADLAQDIDIYTAGKIAGTEPLQVNVRVESILRARQRTFLTDRDVYRVQDQHAEWAGEQRV